LFSRNALPEWARPRLPQTIDGIPVRYLSWKRVAGLGERTAVESGSNHEKRLLRELVRYLKGLMTMQNVTSNMVFVVALGVDPLVDDGPSFADIVTEHGRYFHPISGKWPKTPPNYLGFRFWGELRQIRHVEDYELSDTPWDEIPGLTGQLDWTPAPHFLYRLGPPMTPPPGIKLDALPSWASLGGSRPAPDLPDPPSSARPDARTPQCRRRGVMAGNVRVSRRAVARARSLGPSR
jgi:hypothetical protein